MSKQLHELAVRLREQLAGEASADGDLVVIRKKDLEVLLKILDDERFRVSGRPWLYD